MIFFSFARIVKTLYYNLKKRKKVLQTPRHTLVEHASTFTQKSQNKSRRKLLPETVIMTAMINLPYFVYKRCNTKVCKRVACSFCFTISYQIKCMFLI